MGFSLLSLSLFGLLLMAVTLVLVIYFLVQGMLTVPWVRTKRQMSRRMLELAGFKPGQRVLDLGSGDGSMVFQVAAMGGEGIGMERLWPLVLYTRFRSLFYGRGRATFVLGDFFTHDLPQANIVMAYLFTKVNARLEPRLQEQFPAGTRVVSRDFEFPTLKKLCTEPCGGSRIHVYEI